MPKYYTVVCMLFERSWTKGFLPFHFDREMCGVALYCSIIILMKTFPLHSSHGLSFAKTILLKDVICHAIILLGEMGCKPKN